MKFVHFSFLQIQTADSEYRFLLTSVSVDSEKQTIDIYKF